MDMEGFQSFCWRGWTDSDFTYYNWCSVSHACLQSHSTCHTSAEGVVCKVPFNKVNVIVCTLVKQGKH